MRKDGEATFYTIQAKYIEEDKHAPYYADWFGHIDSENCNCNLMRFKHPKNTNNDPTACGSIWQSYDYHGVTNQKAAMVWLNRAMKYHEFRLLKEHPKNAEERKHYRCKWRIVKITITKKTVPILEMLNYKECIC